MFVTATTHENLKRELQNENLKLRLKYTILLKQWNSLVEKINAKGGEAFLEQNCSTSLSKDDIKKLLMLCHPDKHGGKQLAVDMTTKLLQIKNKL